MASATASETDGYPVSRIESILFVCGTMPIVQSIPFSGTAPAPPTTAGRAADGRLRVLTSRLSSRVPLTETAGSGHRE